MNGVPAMMPMATGRPGLIAIRHNTSRPTLSTPALTWSSSPVETPPVVRIRSWLPATFLQRVCQRRGLVAQNAEIGDLAAQPAQHRHQHEAVGIEQLRRGAGLARRNQFVAGREHRDADAPDHVELGQAEGGGQRDILRPQPLAGFQRGMPKRNILAGRAHIGAGFQPRRQHDLLAFDADVLLHEDRVGAVRHRRAREDAHRVTGPDRLACGAAGLHAPGDGKCLLRRFSADRGLPPHSRRRRNW